MIKSKLPQFPIKGHPFFHGHGVTKGDGIALYSAQHRFWPEKKWYQKIWLWFKYLFHRPRFSAHAVEPVEKVIDMAMNMIHDQNSHQITNQSKLIINKDK